LRTCRSVGVGVGCCPAAMNDPNLEPRSGAEEGALFVRAFVAVELTDGVRAALVAAGERLRSSPARVTWVPAANLHLSLVFLGNVPVARVGDVEAVLESAVAGCAAMAAAVSGIGTFGPPRSPRVVWAGVEPVPGLIRLQGRIADGLRALGLPLENRPYHPHITLGRIKASAGTGDLMRRIERLGPAAFGALPVRETALMRSELRREHAVYARIRGFALAGTPS
jgi:RNA 2',3'-cyclic 3'-phosphodiesterase